MVRTVATLTKTEPGPDDSVLLTFDPDTETPIVSEDLDPNIPIGSYSMRISQKIASEQFALGDRYFVDFTKIGDRATIPHE